MEGSRRVIACGESGLWVVQVSPDGTLTLASVEDLGGPVTGLFVRGGRIWAEIQRLEARPVLRRPGGAAGGVEGRPAAVLPKAPGTIANLDTSSPAPPTRVVPDGEVTESGLGEVVVNIGRADGLRHGERVELSVTTTESVGGEVAKRRRVLSVGVVTTLADGFARVRLGLNEQVPVGAAARVVQRAPSESRTAPPRAAGLWEAGFKARPFVALDGLGGGLFMQAWAGYRFQSHFYLSGELHPFAIGDGKDTPAVVPVAALVMAAYDRDVFSLGLGLGGQTVNATNFTTEAGSGILIAQRLRLGARDGLHLDLRNDVVLFHSRFEFSGLIGTAQIPVGSGTWLLFEGGGGDAGFGYGEIGVRALYRGNGGPGSLFFNVMLGGVTVFKEQSQTCGVDFVFQCPQEVTYGGPTLGVGAEWRF